MSATESPYDARANFTQWKRNRGLPEAFPRLEPIDPTDLPHRFFIADDETLANIEGRIGRPQLAVTVSPGHGCTALHDYVFNLVDRQAEPRRIIPVRIDVSAFFGPEPEIGASLDLDGQIRRGALFNLVRPKRRWHQVALKGDYYRLIGFVDKQELDDYKYLIEVTIRRCAAEPEAWSEVVSLAPAFGADLGELLAAIRDDLTVKPTIFIDIPSRARPDQVAALSTHLKDFFEGAHLGSRRGGPSSIFDVLNVVMFMGKSALSQIRQDVPSLIDIVDVPPYTWGQVCSILERHYAAESGAQAPRPVFSLVDQHFVEKVYSARKPLERIVCELELEILNALDCDPRAVPFSIEVK
jgi:hypothetical protein